MLYVYRKEILLIILFAVLHSLIFHFPSLFWLASFSLIPLFLCLEKLASASEVFWFGYAAGILWSAAAFFWITHVTLLGALALALFLGFYMALFSVLSWRALQVLGSSGSPRFAHGWLKIFTVAGLWTAVEFLRSSVPVMGFPWALFGYSQWKNLVFIQSADIIGAYGVSFILAVFNLCFFLLIGVARRAFRYELRFTASLIQTIAALGIMTVTVGANLAYGIATLEGAEVTRTELSGPRISLVQGNIPQHEKWDERIKEMIFEKYEGLSRQLVLEKPDLVIWPETSFPGYWEDEPEMAARVKSIVRDVRSRFLIGSPTLGSSPPKVTPALDRSRGQAPAGAKSGPRIREDDFFRGGDAEIRLNTALYFGPEGEVRGRYHKLRLVPFGEYVPFFKFLRRYFEIGRFSPGTQAVLFELPYGRDKKTLFGVLICFEDIFPDLCRRLVNSGARVLVNITNDAWFKKTTAPYQHAQASVFRAVENRVPVVRAANTGLSCFIDSSGMVLDSVREGGEELFVTGLLTREIRPGSGTTFYRAWGDAFVFLVFALAVLTFPLYLNRIEKAPSPDATEIES